MKNKHWRMITSGHLTGAENMAFDEALLANFTEDSPPVVRFYGWEPAAISIGRYQDAEKALKVQECAIDGVQIVRRITGGGLIYHHAELTYSIVCRAEDITAKGVKEAYRSLCSFLINFYRKLNLDADFAVNTGARELGRRADFCFAASEEYDIVAGGRKIGGNAQRRMKNIIFQHGSVPVYSRVAAAAKYLQDLPPEIDEASTCLRELGVGSCVGELTDIMAKSFRETFGGNCFESWISAQEQDSFNNLLKNKYKSREWNLYGHRTHS